MKDFGIYRKTVALSAVPQNFFLIYFYIPYLTHQLNQFVPVNFHRNIIRLLYVVSPLQGSDIIISWTPGFVSRAQAPSHTPEAGARPVGGDLSPLRGSSLCYVCFIIRKTPLQKLSFYRQASSRITALDKKFFMPELKFGIQDDRGVQNHHFIVECILVKMVF